MNSSFRKVPRCRGFALIVTLSLMILLTVIAVGLLSLSSISLRSTSQGDSMQIARSNARLALLLAIGDLQKQLGPDTRVSAPADQFAASDPSVSSTPQAQRQWCGAYKSWPAALPEAIRPAPEFLQWFVSGNPSDLTNRTFAGSAIPGSDTGSVEIVTKNTVGASADTVRVPLISQGQTNKTKNRYAWWVSDLGTKALVTPAKEIPTAVAEVRADQQVMPSSNLKAAVTGPERPFALLAATEPKLARIASWQSSSLLADKPENIRGLFHDFTAQSSGLLTNVRAGGFRKDLSMALERTTTNAPLSTSTALYTVGGEPGINLQELWVYYNLHKEVKRSGGAAFTTGGAMASGTPYLQVDASAAACQTDDEFYFKQPVIVSYQMALSLRNIGNRLNIVADPVITLWNPLDVPVVVPTSSFLTVKYWQIPYDLEISRNGTGFATYPLAATLSGATTTTDGDSNFLSVEMGATQSIVFKPGEVIKMSQSGTTLAKSSAGNIHKLAAQKGFNYGGGLSMPVRDRANNYLDLAATDSITYRLVPNNLTAGATLASGHTVETSGTSHTRHYSLTHHEYYIGEDRGTNSLGFGTMSIDWDFGNRRLKPAETRATGDKGTKPAGERLYANESRFAPIFKKISGRTIPASAMTSAKQPIVLYSFNAKTEGSSDLGTRILSRFNPKALHVDFYDLSAKERDMLPYEYSVEELSSWKNRYLEVSTSGNGYFGGGMTAADGTGFLTTHSVPKEPLVSLAAFQHSFANGFDIQKPKYGYATINAREPMLPQIAHAIGNSMACPVLAKDKMSGTLSGSRPLADHSYLANQALWDDWFLSGIAPQSIGFATSRNQKRVASDFFTGTGKLPVVRYQADLRGQDPAKLVSTYFPSTIPTDAATQAIATLIRVDGMFNVNSTSVEAWKSLLGGRKERPVVIRDSNGKESVKTGEPETPVAGLFAPLDAIAKGSGSIDAQDPNQWIGRRTLTDAEIDTLARAIVKEVRKRGPFLCLSDFINRRVGSDAALARAGAIQSALDADDTPVNSAYRSGSRAVSSTTSGRFAFPEAEQGPLAFGSPGIVKQADILTPIAPILSARSDSFLIRGYGEKTDATGKVIARAWCEAVVQRSPQFIDPTDLSDKAYASIKPLNKIFGRRFEIVSFRWLNASEA